MPARDGIGLPRAGARGGVARPPAWNVMACSRCSGWLVTLGGLGRAARDLAAVAGREQHERLGIASLRGLSRAGMRTFCTVILGDSIDSVAFLEVLLFHLCHVLLDDWRHALGHALGLGGQRGDGEREPDSSGERGSCKQTTIHGRSFQGGGLEARLTVSSTRRGKRLQL